MVLDLLSGTDMRGYFSYAQNVQSESATQGECKNLRVQ